MYARVRFTIGVETPQPKRVIHTPAGERTDGSKIEENWTADVGTRDDLFEDTNPTMIAKWRTDRNDFAWNIGTEVRKINLGSKLF